MSDSLRPRGAVEVACPVPGCGWCSWVGPLDPRLPDGPIWCAEHDPDPRALLPQIKVSAWRGEVCKRCGHRNPLGFAVGDADWLAVTGGNESTRCLTCFDEEAEIAGVRYTLIGDVYPIAWWMWADGVSS